MNWQGKIDFMKPVTLLGKPHGIEHLPTLETWSIEDLGRTVHTEDTGKLWFATSTRWDELTSGGIAVHTHDDRYYTETEVNSMFDGRNGKKQIINWINILNKPTLFTPDLHGNGAHDKEYVASVDITHSLLNTNNLIGVGANQIASGNHSHTATQTAYDNTSSGMIATNLQSAVDNINTSINTVIGSVITITNTTTSLGAEVGVVRTDTQKNTDDISQLKADVLMINDTLGVIPTTTNIPVDTPVAGTFKFDAATKTLYIFDGSTWVSTVLS